MTALLSGAVLAAIALVFVLWPLIWSASDTPDASRRAERSPARDSAVRALREIEFDRATGKLGDGDYDSLKRDYTARALAELRDAVAPVTAPNGPEGADRAEVLIRAARSAAITCAQCDTVCPEPDAIYCSSCGSYLPGKCGKCGAAALERGARFCVSCGWQLAA